MYLEELFLNIKITAGGRTELERLDFDIEKSIQGIIEYVPKVDFKGISYILVTDLPLVKKGKRKSAQASYKKKHGINPAYIEVYLKNLFSHIRSVESFKLMAPIQEHGLAWALFHEIGHHVRVSKSHGVKTKKSEAFADNYADMIMQKFILKTSNSVKDCFTHLESVAEEKGLTMDTIKNMKRGWKIYLEKARANTRASYGNR